MAWDLGISCLSLGPSGVALDFAGALACATAQGHDAAIVSELLVAVQAGMFAGQSKKQQQRMSNG